MLSCVLLYLVGTVKSFICWVYISIVYMSDSSRLRKTISTHRMLSSRPGGQNIFAHKTEMRREMFKFWWSSVNITQTSTNESENRPKTYLFWPETVAKTKKCEIQTLIHITEPSPVCNPNIRKCNRMFPTRSLAAECSNTPYSSEPNDSPTVSHPQLDRIEWTLLLVSLYRRCTSYNSKAKLHTWSKMCLYWEMHDLWSKIFIGRSGARRPTNQASAGKLLALFLQSCTRRGSDMLLHEIDQAEPQYLDKNQQYQHLDTIWWHLIWLIQIPTSGRHVVLVFVSGAPWGLRDCSSWGGGQGRHSTAAWRYGG